jgi:hypothetical protein
MTRRIQTDAQQNSQPARADWLMSLKTFFASAA